MATLVTERGVYPMMHAPSQNETAMDIVAEQFLIRVSEHVTIIESLMRQIATSAGLSPQTIGLTDGASGETATGVHARTSLTRETREAATRYWTGPLEQIIEAVLVADPKVEGDKVSEEVVERKPATGSKAKAKQRTERYEVTHKGETFTVERNVDTGESKRV